MVVTGIQRPDPCGCDEDQSLELMYGQRTDSSRVFPATSGLPFKPGKSGPKRYARKTWRAFAPPRAPNAGRLYCHTTFFCGVTSKTIPGAPAHIKVLPFGRR